jgi:hypothetical protein
VSRACARQRASADSYTGTIAFAWSTSSARSKPLPTKPRAPRAAAEHEHRDRPSAVPLLDPSQHLPAVHLRHHHVEEDELGPAALDRLEPLVGTRRLPYVVALALELEPDELAHPRVVVDEQDGRPGPRSRGARAREKCLEVVPPEAPVAARCVEGGDLPLVRPPSHRALGDTEESCGLPEREPLGIAPPAVVAVPHRGETHQSSLFLHRREETCADVPALTARNRRHPAGTCRRPPRGQS